MRWHAALPVVAVLLECVAAAGWLERLESRSLKTSRTLKRQTDASTNPGFVTIDQNTGQFVRNGKPFFYFGTNAYWLAHLSDDNLNKTLVDIASRNITVVRTWAFNDVTEIPSSGAFFQVLNPNGTITINDGPSGLQRLDKILDLAEPLGLTIQFVLTNNWNPATNGSDVTALSKRQSDGSTPAPLPRGTLSNDYGGMDAYVRAFGLQTHDQFFSNDTLITAFENYLTALIPRYANRTSVLAWELANDPRCNSSLVASPSCNTNIVTSWHSRVAQKVKVLDPNHAVASGSQGFMCVASATNPCTKLFFKPKPTPTPPSTPSPAPGNTKRKLALTERELIAQQRSELKKELTGLQRKAENAATKRKRGEKARWEYRGNNIERAVANVKRQTQNTGALSSQDGSQGVDSLDIGSIPQIGFSTFQLFPDQDTYSAPSPNLDAFNNTLQTGISWIQTQAAAAAILNKPITVTGFGLVTQANLPSFVPFNASTPLFPNATAVTSTTSAAPVPTPPLGVGVEQGQVALTEEQQAQIYQAWIQEAISQDIQGIVQYQWGQSNLTPNTQNTSPTTTATENTFSPLLPTGEQNVSPNDGYLTTSPLVQNVLQLGAIQQNLRNIDIASAFTTSR